MTVNPIEPGPALVRIKRKTFPFAGYAETSAAYRQTIDSLGLGASDAPSCDLLAADGTLFGHVSYNGRVWRGTARDWKPGIKPLYCPYGGEQ